VKDDEIMDYNVAP